MRGERDERSGRERSQGGPAAAHEKDASHGGLQIRDFVRSEDAAITLYESVGFRQVDAATLPNLAYSRVNVLRMLPLV